MSTPAPPLGRPRVFTTADGTNRGSFTLDDWALFWSLGLIWGSSFLFIDIGLDGLRPGLVTWLRVALGAAALWSVPRARKTIDPADRPRLWALSILWVSVPFTLFPIAQQWIDSAVAGMLNGAMPIFAAAIAAAMLGRPPRTTQQAGLAAGLAGVVAIGLPSASRGETQALGVVLVVLATLCYGLAVNIAAPIQQRYGSLPVMARMLALAAVWTLPLGLTGLSGSRLAWGLTLAVTSLGVLQTGIAFVLMASLVGRVGSTRSSFIAYAIPVVALGLGVAFRGEQVAPVAVAGVVLVIAGALLASGREA